MTDQHPGREPKHYCDPHDISLLQEPLRSIVGQIIHDAPTHGIIPVSIVRTPDMQFDLRVERVGFANVFRFPPKGHPTTAVPPIRNADGTWPPGGSNHPKGLAADLGGRDMPWLRRHLDDYGVCLPVPGENWHIQLSGKPPRVPITPFGQLHNRNQGRHWTGVMPGDTDATVYARGGYDNQVSEAQIRLKKRGFYHGEINGWNDSSTQAATSNFKLWTIGIQKAFHKPVWPNHDSVIGTTTIAWLRQVTA